MKMSRLVAFSSSLLLGAALALTGAGVANADSSVAAVDYVALGDSYSSGVGAGSYDGSSCKRSSRAYPALWAAANSPSSFDFAACSGARTGDVTGGQLGLAERLDRPRLDLHRWQRRGLRRRHDDLCPAVRGHLSQPRRHRPRLCRLHPARQARLRVHGHPLQGPSAQVVVLGYPRFYQLGGGCLMRPEREGRSAISRASDHLNTATAKRAADHGFTFGDVRATFTGHEICSGNAWLHSVNWLNIGESYHPTAAGQSGGYLPVLNSAL